MSQRTDALADRLEQGANALVEFAEALTDAESRIRIPKDGRTIGVIVHHVASVYPLEIRLAQMVADGKSVEDVTGDKVDQTNADHAQKNDGITPSSSAGKQTGSSTDSFGAMTKD